MRYILLSAAIAIVFSACKKDKYNTVPQIDYKSISPVDWYSGNADPYAGPVLTFKLTDSEGDFGFNDNKDTSYIYITSLNASNSFRSDSLKFPVLTSLNRKNLNVEVDANLRPFMFSNSSTPHTDTLKFQVYVKDFAKHKSNVITVGPVYFHQL